MQPSRSRFILHERPEFALPMKTRSANYWWVVVVLMLIATYSFVDRAILSLVVDPIRHDLGLSDVQMSLLLGLTFALFYCLCNIPAGYLTDRLDRRKFVAVASALWALMTILCGTAQSPGQIFLGRAGVGLAEGVISPASFAMIRDVVPARKRAMAFSIFALAPVLGTGLSLVGGGLLLKIASSGGFANVPLFAMLRPWQVTLVTVGLLGLPLSLLLFTFPHPERETVPERSASVFAGLAVAMRHVRAERTLYLPLMLFAAVSAMQNFAINSWLPAAFGRYWLLPPEQVGPPLGLMTFFGSSLGLVVGGMAMNRALASGRTALGIGSLAVAMTALGLIAAFIAPTAFTAFGGLLVCQVFIGISYAAAITTLAEITPAEVMGRISAVYVLIQMLAGYTLGPLIVSLVSQYLLWGASALPLALCAVVGCYATVSASSGLILRQRIEGGKAAAAVRLQPRESEEIGFGAAQRGERDSAIDRNGCAHHMVTRAGGQKHGAGRHVDIVADPAHRSHRGNLVGMFARSVIHL